MYDYSDEEDFTIEDVDHEIEIIGVKAANGHIVILMFGIGLVFGGTIAAMIALGATVLVCRRFYAAELRGEPITFNRKVLRLIRRVPYGLGSYLVPGTGAIVLGLDRYRE